MIQPQELRIGNLFHSTKRIKGIKMPFGVAKVLTLGLFDLEWLLPDQIPAQVEVWNKSEYSEIEPIPLTPEWLEKFGFTNHKLILPDHVAFQSYLIAQLGANRIQICKNGYYAYDPEVQYVHQLQNLYFALTGEELTIESQVQTQPPKTEAQEP